MLMGREGGGLEEEGEVVMGRSGVLVREGV